MLRILEASLRIRERPHFAAFERAAQDPERTQARLLARLLAANADTAFGRDHGFARLRTPGDYAHALPVSQYERFRPYVRRLMDGERAVLTRDPPVMFTTTSGTTGEPKYLPAPHGWREEMAALMRLWMRLALRDHPRFFARRLLTIVSPAVEGHTSSGIPFGALSGVTYQRIPWMVRRDYAIPYACCLVKDPDQRYFVTMRIAMQHSVSAIGTPNPSTLLRLAGASRDRAEELLRAVHDGSLGLKPEFHPCCDAAEARAALAASCRPDPPRAKALEAAAAKDGALLPKHAWPELQLIGCWLGGSAGVHARRLAEPYGDVPLRDLGLLASEGRMTVPIEDGTPAGVLAVHKAYLEFIPDDRRDDPDPPVLRAHEIEEGRRYFVVLTGRNGLYRYDMNDVVETRGFHHRTPKVAFLRKGRDVLSITGEKVHVSQVQAAVRDAEAAAGVELFQWRLVANVDGARHDLLVEPRALLGDEEARVLLQAFDTALRKLNVEYESKRHSARLAMPRLFAMRAGWSERQCRADFARGKREDQYKWSALRDAWDEASRAEVVTQWVVPRSRL